MRASAEISGATLESPSAVSPAAHGLTEGAEGADGATSVAALDRGMQPISGWGRFPVQSCRVYEPADADQLAGLIGRARDRSLIARGLGRSYGDAALNRDAGTVSLLRLDRILALDSATGVIECEAGASLDQIIRYALPRGFFLPVTPGTRQVTMGGAIAADVHGKNHHRAGSFSNFVLDLDLVTGEGERLECSPKLHPEVFWATVGGMGLTGFITRARVQLRPVESAVVRVRLEKARSLGRALELLEAGDLQHEYSVAWVDCLASGSKLGRSLVMLGRHALASELRKNARSPLELKARRAVKVPFALPFSPLRRWTVAAFNDLYLGLRPPLADRLVDFNHFFYPLDAVQNWNLLYGPDGFVQFQVVAPHAAALAVFTSLLRRIQGSGRAPFLGVLKRFGEGSDGMLSFPMAGATLALDLPVDRDLPRFLQELEAMVADHGGRNYLAKDATGSAQAFARGYPRLNEFRAVCERLDPRRRISSSLARRLKILDA